MDRILIVEDDADLVEAYTDLLEAKGYATISASSAADAIQLAVSTEPLIVILDLGLSGSSGTRVLDFIRGYKPLENTRILVVTGHSETTDPRFLAIGPVEQADFVLTKPVPNEHLLAVIERLVRYSEATSLATLKLSNIVIVDRPVSDSVASRQQLENHYG